MSGSHGTLDKNLSLISVIINQIMKIWDLHIWYIDITNSQSAKK